MTTALQQQVYSKAAPAAKKPPFANLHELLTEEGLDEIAPAVIAAAKEAHESMDDLTTLRSLALMVGGDRAEFLDFLKTAGVTSLADRQKCANAIGKAVREERITRGWERPTPARDNCAKCGVRASESRKLLTCTRCRSVKYCSAACQKGAWATHKLVCKPPQEAEGTVTGRAANPRLGGYSLYGDSKSRHVYSTDPIGALVHGD